MTVIGSGYLDAVGAPRMAALHHAVMCCDIDGGRSSNSSDSYRLAVAESNAPSVTTSRPRRTSQQKSPLRLGRDGPNAGQGGRQAHRLMPMPNA